MTEAFEIGVTLALSDGVSEGIAQARRDMVGLEQVLHAGGVSVHQLRATAQTAVSAVRQLPSGQQPALKAADVPFQPGPMIASAIRTPPDTLEAVGWSSEGLSGPATPVVPAPLVMPAAIVIPVTPNDFARPLPERPSASSAPQLITAARALDGDGSGMAPARAEVQRSDVASQPWLLTPTEESRATPQSPAPPGPAIVVSAPVSIMQHPKEEQQALQSVIVAPGNRSAGGELPSSPLMSPAQQPFRWASAPAPVWMAAGRSATSPDAGPAEAATTASPVVSERPRDPGQLPAAPVSRQPSSAQAPGGQESGGVQSRLPASAAEGGEKHGPTEGDVFLDGMLVGRWISRFLAQEAGRASSGPTGFDSRRGRLLPGPTVGS